VSAKIADNACVFAALDFDLTTLGRFHDAVDGALARIGPKGMFASPVQYILRLPEGHGLLGIGLKRLFWQFLGLSQWRDNLAEYVDISNMAVEKLGVRKFGRVGFKIMAFIPLGMTHAEMSRLMFGSYLAEHDDLAPVLGEIEDPYVQFHGKRADLDYSLTLTAMTKANITSTFGQIPNIANFLEDKYLDDSLREFHDRISAQEAFFFDVDFSQSDVPSQNLAKFLSSSITEAELLTEACVGHLQAKPLKK